MWDVAPMMIEGIYPGAYPIWRTLLLSISSFLLKDCTMRIFFPLAVSLWGNGTMFLYSDTYPAIVERIVKFSAKWGQMVDIYPHF